MSIKYWAGAHLLFKKKNNCEKTQSECGKIKIQMKFNKHMILKKYENIVAKLIKWKAG